MTRLWPLLLSLAAIWGASYLFIKVAVDEVEPAPMMAIRLFGAAVLLGAYLVWSLGAARAVADVRDAWRPAVVLGAINAAVPFWLVAWGEKHVDSSIAAIAQATVPIFVLLIGLRFLPQEPVGAGRLLGVALGIVGVAVLAGFNPVGGADAVVGTLAVVLASLSYAAGGVYGQKRVRSVSGPVLATGSMLAGGLILLPIALVQIPGRMPSLEAWASIAALTVLGTALAQLILYRMLRLHGSAKVSLVTYLMPGFAIVYGALLLDEPITAAVIGGLALILAGVALGSGAVKLPRREQDRLRPVTVTVAIRRAREDDVDFLVSLVDHEEVAPFLAVAGSRSAEELLEEIRAGESDPDAGGRFVIEVDGFRAGTMRFRRTNRRSRIAHLGGLAVHPDFRGRRVSDEAALQLIAHLFGELGYHRLELEVYGFNERAIAHAERIGFVREGIRRRAYRRDEGWEDGVMYGLLPEDRG